LANIAAEVPGIQLLLHVTCTLFIVLCLGSSSLSADTAAAKIVELSKKVRELNASLEAKKTEAKQLFGRCRHLENEVC